MVCCCEFKVVLFFLAVCFIITAQLICSFKITTVLKNNTILNTILKNKQLIILCSVVFLFMIFMQTLKIYEISFLFGHVFLTNGALLAVKFYSICFVLFSIILKKQRDVSSSSTFMYIFVANIFCSVIWMINSLISFIFIIDTLNILMYLLLFNARLSDNTSAFTKKLNGLSVYFWTSFYSTILFFIFIILLYANFYTLNFYTLTLFLTTASACINTFYFIKYLFAFTVLALFFFFKCGLAPFFYWKTTFLRATSLTLLIYYVVIYFSTLFLFMLYFFFIQLAPFIFITRILLLFLCTCGLLVTGLAVFGTYDIFSFLTFSSVLNGIFVLLFVCLLCDNALLLL